MVSPMPPEAAAETMPWKSALVLTKFCMMPATGAMLESLGVVASESWVPPNSARAWRIPSFRRAMEVPSAA